MSPEAQRIAIAKACGWTFRPSDGARTPPGKKHAIKGVYYTETIPDFLNDLNAMAEAEKVLTHRGGTLRDYVERLQDAHGSYGCVMATAAQRSESFLRTLNLWTQ